MGTSLKEMRESRGLKQEFLANLLGISTANYSKKENGMIKFSLCEAKKIADYFGKTVEDIFFSHEVSKMETRAKNRKRGES